MENVNWGFLEILDGCHIGRLLMLRVGFGNESFLFKIKYVNVYVHIDLIVMRCYVIYICMSNKL